MNDVNKEKAKKDSRIDTRSGTERRQFQYTAYIPERRTGQDRRGLIERIKASERRVSLNH